MLADVIIFVYEVPCIFWRYINVDEVSLITLKKLLQSAMELLQIATASFITKCNGQLLQIATAFLLQSATRFITNCDRYYKVRWIYYKLRQVLQSAMIITNCDSTTSIKVLIFLLRLNDLSNKILFCLPFALPCLRLRLPPVPNLWLLLLLFQIHLSLVSLRLRDAQ